jgi:hypothetical protein
MRLIWPRWWRVHEPIHATSVCGCTIMLSVSHHGSGWNHPLSLGPFCKGWWTLYNRVRGVKGPIHPRVDSGKQKSESRKYTKPYSMLDVPPSKLSNPGILEPRIFSLRFPYDTSHDRDHDGGSDRHRTGDPREGFIHGRAVSSLPARRLRWSRGAFKGDPNSKPSRDPGGRRSDTGRRIPPSEDIFLSIKSIGGCFSPFRTAGPGMRRGDGEIYRRGGQAGEESRAGRHHDLSDQ